MIGILFHGPEVFDSGWAGRIIDAMSRIDKVRCLLAGTMGRTAVFDSGLQGIECPGKQPAQLLQEVESDWDVAIFANYGKSEYSGLTFGAMVVDRSHIRIPCIQVECSSSVFVEWTEGSDPRLIATLDGMGLKRRERISLEPSVWEEEGRICRRMTTAARGDFILVNGIVIGKATGEEVVIECADRQIITVRGAKIKAHGVEKLARLGGVDLREAKLVSTPTIRRTSTVPRIEKTSGRGMVFIDHAGMYVYDLIKNVEGAVTVGDDTTAVVGDILYRFQMPLIGIIDGDKDTVLRNTRFTPGSVTFTVREDDCFGLRVFSEIFKNHVTIEESYDVVRRRVSELVVGELVLQHEY